MAALNDDTRGGARDAAEDADSEESSDGVGARSTIFFEVKVASEMSAEKGGLRIPSLGVIMNFWFEMGMLSCFSTSCEKSTMAASSAKVKVWGVP